MASKRASASASPATSGLSENTGSTLKDKPLESKDKMKDADSTTPVSQSNLPYSKEFEGTMQAKLKDAMKRLKRVKKNNPEQYEEEKKKVLLKLAPQIMKSKNARGRVMFPVGKLKKRLASHAAAGVRVPTEAAVALAATLDYCVGELLDQAVSVTSSKKCHTIVPRHIKLCIPNDESLAMLFRKVTIPQGGVVPKLHPELAMGYKTRAKRKFSAKRPFADVFGDTDDGFDGKPKKKMYDAKPGKHKPVFSTNSSEPEDKKKGKDKEKAKGGETEKKKNASSSPHQQALKKKPLTSSSPQLVGKPAKGKHATDSESETYTHKGTHLRGRGSRG